MRNRLLALLLGCSLGFALVEGVLQLVIGDYRGVVSGTTESPNAALYGWGFPPGWEHRWRDFDSGEEITVTMNSRGFKDREREVEKRPGERRIVLLGDSHVFGLVELEAQINLLLEARLVSAGCPSEVIGLAYGGWSTDQELVVLAEEGLAYQPDVVVLQISSNDLEGNGLARDNAGAYQGIERNKPFRFELRDGELHRIDSPPPPPSMGESIKRWLRPLVTYRLLITAKERFRNRRGEPVRAVGGPPIVFERDDRAWDLLTALLREMRRLSDEAGAPLVLFAVDPEDGLLDFYLSHGQLEPIDGGRYREVASGRSGDFFFAYHELERVAAELALPLVPIKRSYTRFENDFHPNREGNRRIVEDLFDFLTASPLTAPRLCP